MIFEFRVLYVYERQWKWGSVTGRFSISDGGSITWYEPPPVETITDLSVIRTVNRNLSQGFEEQLSCNFRLTADLTLSSVTVELEGVNTDVATYLQLVKRATVANGFQDRFNVSWIPSKLTLTIFNVTTDDEDVFICNVEFLDVGGINTWRRKVKVTVLGKFTNSDSALVSILLN